MQGSKSAYSVELYEVTPKTGGEGGTLPYRSVPRLQQRIAVDEEVATTHVAGHRAEQQEVVREPEADKVNKFETKESSGFPLGFRFNQALWKHGFSKSK